MIQVGDLNFKELISESQLNDKIKELGHTLQSNYDGKNPLFIAVLNGSFVFMSDLFKNIDIKCEVSFVKIKSYEATQSSGEVKELIGLSEDLKNRHVVLVEDIVETGLTLAGIRQQILNQKPASLKICTLLYKPTEFIQNYTIDYVGFVIAHKFVVGYGLDYNGEGRNLNALYVKI